MIRIPPLVLMVSFPDLLRRVSARVLHANPNAAV